MKRLQLLMCALFLSGGLFAQLKDLSIELETGGSFYFAQSVDKSYLRKENVYPDYSNDFKPSVEVVYGMYFGGLKLQLQSPNERWKFSSGLRFIQTYSEIAKTNDQDYFYFLYQQTANSLDYLRVKSIAQTTSYVGIPLEVRYFPFSKLRAFKVFFTAGTQIGYKLTTKTKVTFADSNMNPFASSVESIVEQPDDFLSTVYAGAGFELHKASWPVISFTVILPSVVISNHEQLVTPTGGAGLQLSIQLPFKKSK